MKFFATLLILLSFSFASAQNVETITNDEVKTETTVTVENTVVISVKGIKTMEEIDIENYNKSTYLKLIATKKTKNKTC